MSEFKLKLNVSAVERKSIITNFIVIAFFGVLAALGWGTLYNILIGVFVVGMIVAYARIGVIYVAFGYDELCRILAKIAVSKYAIKSEVVTNPKTIGNVIHMAMLVFVSVGASPWVGIPYLILACSGMILLSVTKEKRLEHAVDYETSKDWYNGIWENSKSFITAMTKIGASDFIIKSLKERTERQFSLNKSKERAEKVFKKLKALEPTLETEGK